MEKGTIVKHYDKAVGEIETLKQEVVSKINKASEEEDEVSVAIYYGTLYELEVQAIKIRLRKRIFEVSGSVVENKE